MSMTLFGRAFMSGHERDLHDCEIGSDTPERCVRCIIDIENLVCCYKLLNNTSWIVE